MSALLFFGFPSSFAPVRPQSHDTYFLFFAPLFLFPKKDSALYNHFLISFPHLNIIVFHPGPFFRNLLLLSTLLSIVYTFFAPFYQSRQNDCHFFFLFYCSRPPSRSCVFYKTAITQQRKPSSLFCFCCLKLLAFITAHMICIFRK